MFRLIAYLRRPFVRPFEDAELEARYKSEYRATAVRVGYLFSLCFLWLSFLSCIGALTASSSSNELF
jgi:hypothetical protein